MSSIGPGCAEDAAKPHANLTALHYIAFMAAMLAVYGWGLAVLERDLAASATTTLIAER